MGAQSFINTISSTNYSKGFNDLVDRAIYENGNDHYNGTISTTDLIGPPIKIADVYSKSAMDKAYKYVEEHDYGRKWEARCLDLGVEYYLVREVKVIVHKAQKAPKYEIAYLVGNDRSFKDLKSAKDFAEKYVLKNGGTIQIRKTKVIADGEEDVYQYKTVETRRDKIGNLKSKPGREIIPVHRYMYYGWAAV